MIETAKAIFVYEADTSDLKAKLKEVQGEEKKALEAQLKNAEARNANIEKWISGIGKATLALGAAAAAGALLWEGMEHNARRAQLSANVTAEAVSRLSKGFGGLRTEMESLEAANALNNSKLKLTSDQMETVGKGMRELVREGHSWEEVTKKVTDAFVKLNGGGLDDFGILIDDAKTDGEKFNAIMDAMAAKAGKVGDGTRTSAEEMQGLKVTFADVMDQVKQALGEIAIAFMPIVEALAQAAKYVGDIASYLPSGSTLKKVGKYVGYINPIGQGRRAIGAAYDYFSRDTGNLNGGFHRWTPIPDELQFDPANPYGRQSMLQPNNPFVANENLLSSTLGGLNDMNMLAYLATGKGNELLGKLAEKNKKNIDAAKAAKEKYDAVWNRVIGDMIAGSAPADNSNYESPAWAWEESPAAFASISQQPGISNAMLDKYGPGGVHDATAYNRYQRAKQQSFLESTFGALAEFDAYKTAFETLNGAIGTAFSAWIDGSASAGEAFKKFIGEALKGVAVQMAMESIKHAAYAIGSLAFGNLAGAATHGKAAAAFAAGAVVVGVAAKAMHSGGGASASPGGGVPAYSGGQQQQQQSQTMVIAYGQDYSDDTARQRALRAAKAAEQAKQYGSSGAVTYP